MILQAESNDIVGIQIIVKTMKISSKKGVAQTLYHYSANIIISWSVSNAISRVASTSVTY